MSECDLRPARQPAEKPGIIRLGGVWRKMPIPERDATRLNPRHGAGCPFEVNNNHAG